MLKHVSIKTPSWQRVKKNYKTINSSHMMDDLDLISLSRTGKEEGGGEEGGHTSELPFGIY